MCFSYYGSKARIRHHYPAPLHDTIKEPFCGAAQYALLYPDRQVKLFDLDQKVIGVWNYLIRATPKDIQDLPVLVPGDNLDDFNLSEAERWFLGFLINPGSAAPKKTVSKRSSWDDYHRRLISQTVTRIKHWTAELSDFRDVPNEEPATWFVDPPYSGTGGGKWYRKTMKPEDFTDLRQHVESWKGQIIVCEQIGATWLDFQPLIVHRSQTVKWTHEGIHLRTNA